MHSNGRTITAHAFTLQDEKEEHFWQIRH